MHGFSPDTPWSKLSEEARRLVLDGAGKELVTDKDRTTGRRMSAPRPFEGFRHAILSRYAKGTKASESLAFLICQGPCPDCDGTRWSYQARALRIGGIGIQHILAKPFIDLVAFTQDGSDFVKAVPPRDSALVRVLHHRAAAFVSLGLGHLTGDRGMPDVSEGESRRARLAAVLNAHHAGLCMLLDEPARGLHDEDVQNMTSAVTELARMHTVVVNEHRHAFAGAANHVIELGPGAGDAGGEVVYAGPVAQSSWAKELVIERERPHPRSKNPAVLAIRGATIHNLEGVDCTIPLGRLTCLTGVSGSGKSNFVRGILVPAVARSLPSPMQLDDFDQRQGTWSSFDGVERIKGMVALDQKAPPPNRRSIVATLLGVADPIRTAFGASPEARRASLSASDFGLNAGRGRCQHCLGIGEVEEHDQWTPCPVCGGTRFGQEALSVRVGGVNINEVLNAPIANLTGRAPVFLSEYLPVLTAMVDLGIGHVALGRRLDTLSGGEIQRLRIATKLAEHGSGGLLFVLDEPAAGLHPRDVERLVGALDRILDHGKNTVVLVEHNPAIIRAADWLIEFGPGSGPHGGRVVASGTPEEVRKTDTATGRVLSNKPAPLHPRQLSSSSTKQQAHHEPRVLEQQAERMKAWIRHLIGDDVARPDDGADGDATDRPVAALDDHFWQGRRAWEIGGLDLEIAKLLLDVQARRATADDITSLAQEWTKHRDARLVIQPFLKDIQVWGARLPASTVGEASAHIRSMGLDLIDADGSGVKRGNPDWPGIRATGDRFNPRDGSLDERRRAIADALTLGGGYAELRGPRGVCCGWFGHRLLDLEHGIVAPMIPVPVHFSRHNRAGQCPMCRGNGHVMTLKEELVIGDRRATPEADGFLHASAATVMKGVRRSELIPFLRRLEEEGLWDRSAPYQRLDPSARDLLFFGCWTRPGHGTFLKSAKEDPSEVGAWLRWDGLYHALWGQFERSTDARWREAVKQSRSTRTCPSCEGTGLAAHGKLLRLGDRSLYEWVRDGTAGDFGEALKSLKTSAPRQKRTRERILTCLAPLVEREGSQPFHAMVEDDLGREISRRVVEAFTDMPVVFT
jgi:excinuclease UvrABC ATPase subunit